MTMPVARPTAKPPIFINEETLFLKRFLNAILK
jgi:hypothetical protein